MGDIREALERVCHLKAMAMANRNKRVVVMVDDLQTLVTAATEALHAPADDAAIERVARAVREEIVRQYRDDDRGKCPAGTAFYEEHIGPDALARAAIKAYQETARDPA